MVPALVSISAACPVQSKTRDGAPPACVSIFWRDALLRCPSLLLQVLSTTDATITLLPQNIIHLFLCKTSSWALSLWRCFFHHARRFLAAWHGAASTKLSAHISPVPHFVLSDRERSRFHLPLAVVGLFQTRLVPIALCYQEEQWFVSDLSLDHDFSTGGSAR